MIINHGFLIIKKFKGMDIECTHIELNKHDHLSIKYFYKKDFKSNLFCNFCKNKLNDLIILNNKNYFLKVEIGYCEKCNSIQKKQLLKTSKTWFKNSWYKKHIRNSKKKIIPDYSIYEIFKNRINQKALVLDLGCGNGDKLLAFKKKGFFVEGIEPSKGLVTEAKNYIKNIKCQTSEDFLKSNKKKYDLIICNDTLQFIENPNKSIKNSLKFLKRGGYLYIKLGSIESKNLIHFTYQGLVLNILTAETILNNFSKKYKVKIFNKNPLQVIIQKDNIKRDQIEINNYNFKNKLFKDLNYLKFYFLKNIKLNWNQRVFFLTKMNFKKNLPVRIYHNKNYIPLMMK